MRNFRLTVTACVLGMVIACSGSSVEGELLVSAAASLTDAFAEMESAFEDANPDVDVLLNLGSSSALREQILEGAPADVFASANTSNMDQVAEAGELAGDAEIFVTNSLQIAVPTGNPAEVTGLEDFAREELLIGLCAEDVPCGDFGRQALENAGVIPSIDTNEPDVRALLTKIEAGELDAGITYVTDVLSASGTCRRSRHPRGGERRRRVSDRDLDRCAQPRRGRGLGGVRAFRGGTGDPDQLWIHVTLKADASLRRTRRPPVLLVVLGSVGLAMFVVPFVGLLARVPWSDLPALLASDVVTDALRLSMVTSLTATAIAVVVGIPLAWMMARLDFPGRPLVRGLVTLPLVLPPVVGGAALLFALGRRGLVGESLEQATGLLLPFSTWGVVVANTFVAMPFLVITVEGALRNLDQRYEGAAASLGASRWTVLRRVTLPMIGPSLVAGLVLTWARAFGEFGATITFAGNLQGRTQTLPLAVFVALESDRDTAVALSLVMVVVSLAVLVGLRERWWKAL